MAIVYIADELIFQIREAGMDKTKFIREAIEEKLKEGSVL